MKHLAELSMVVLQELNLILNDALTGRWVSPEDNLDEMLKRVEEIQNDNLYVWSFRGLKAE